jgi:hypothetical protein
MENWREEGVFVDCAASLVQVVNGDIRGGGMFSSMLDNAMIC